MADLFISYAGERPRQRALSAARRALELNRRSAFAQFALAEIQYFTGNLDAFHAAAEQAVRLNPLDTDATAMIGIMQAYAGDWERGVARTRRTMQLNPRHPGWYHYAAFFQAYLAGEYERTLDIAYRVNLPGYFADPYTRAIAHAQLGQMDQARTATEEFLALWGVDLGSFAQEHLQKWFYAQPKLIEAIVDGLRKAGLDL